MKNQIRELELKANQIRADALKMLNCTTAGHIGGTLSCCDILVALYYRFMHISPETADAPDRDRFVLSKGHCLETQLCILADKGFISRGELQTFGQNGSRLYGHPNREIPGVEVNTGALGHGLSLGAGMALEGKRKGYDYNVYVVMGDGEQAEGSLWEAAMFASNYSLDNLYAIVDRNHFQISGCTEDVMKLEPLADKWRAFGFEVYELENGNDMTEICRAFDSLQNMNGKPKLLLANTVKGKGVSFMENNLTWHHGGVNDEQLHIALKELEKSRKELST